MSMQDTIISGDEILDEAEKADFWRKFAAIENEKSSRMVRLATWAHWVDDHTGLILACIGLGIAIGTGIAIAF